MTVGAVSTFAVAAFLLNLSPGPSILFVMSRGIAGGKRAGAFAAMGLATGSALWAVLTALGISLVLRTSEVAFNSLRYLGAVYLVWLGISGLRSGAFTVREPGQVVQVSALKSYFQGFFVEGTNPKTVTFYLALVIQVTAQFVDYSLVAVMLFCLIVPLTALPIDLTVGITGGKLASTISRRPSVGNALNIVSSLILFGLATLVILG